MALNRAPARDWQRGATALCGYIPGMASSFIKMNGLGNDFIIVTGDFTPDTAWLRAVCDRKTGIGCDQFILLRPLAARRCLHAHLELGRRPRGAMR